MFRPLTGQYGHIVKFIHSQKSINFSTVVKGKQEMHVYGVEIFGSLVGSYGYIEEMYNFKIISSPLTIKEVKKKYTIHDAFYLNYEIMKINHYLRGSDSRVSPMN